MASIQTAIELNDQFSGVLNNIISSVNLAITSMYDMQQSINADIDTRSIEGARHEINQATMAIHAMNEALSNQTAPDILPSIGDGWDQEPVSTTTVPRLPEIWQTDNLDTFTDTGIERFQQEMQSAHNMLNTLNETQERIVQTASGMDILPDEAVLDMDVMQQRLRSIQHSIQQIESNPLNVGSDRTNAELEQLRSQLNTAIHEQNELNQAIQNMDVASANSAYLRLSQTVSRTERYIRDNADEQEYFNQRMSEGVSHSNHLLQKVTGIVGAYATLHTMGNIIGLSDELTLTTARLNNMNDGMQTTEELVDMVYAAAENSRGSFSDMANIVARIGNNAKDAFGSSAEVVAFSELVQKQMTIAGASTTEASNAILQLSQALGSGVLRGDELNSIFEQAPNLVQNIADYLNVPIGKIREMASEGELSAGVVKQAIFASADEINAKFESMPMTWGQIWSQIKNDAVDAFEPVLQRINDLANSEKFQAFVNQVSINMQTLANIVLYVFDLMGEVGSFVEDNWSIISPIVYGVVAAMAAYVAVSTIVAVINGIMATAAAVHAAAEMMQAGATFAATVAQHGLNAALLACPLTWIILLIIALIAIIFAVCSAIAKLTGVADSGFGVIAGGVNVVIQFFKNFGLTVANIALGIGNAIAALGSNMMTAFHNAICSVQAWWYDLLSTCLSVIENICVALNKLPFVEFDYSGISSAADEYAAKAIEVVGNKDDYQNIGEAFSNGFNTFDTFQNGWVSDAFEAGASWGDGVSEAVSNFSFSDLLGGRDKLDEKVPRQDDFLSGFQDTIGDNLGSIAGDTGAIKDSMDITEEELKYLRDAAEQEAVNRFTTAEISVDMSGMQNTVNSGDDLDGFMSRLTDSVNEAVDSMTEGVHE